MGIDKTLGCYFCGVEVCFPHGFVGVNHIFCSDECAEAYLSTKQPLSCPFCGASAEVHNYDRAGWCVECRNKQCPVQPDTQGFHPTRVGAVQTWNIRN
jgi:hypothetical protein